MFGLGQSREMEQRFLPAWAAPCALAAVLCLLFCSTAQASGAGIAAWGSNERGQVGNGTGSESVTAAVPVSGIASAVQVSGGSGSAVALLADGTVRAWGSNSVS